MHHALTWHSSPIEVLEPIRVETLSDDDLLYCHRTLHYPAIIDRRWIPRLEAEMRRRGILTIS